MNPSRRPRWCWIPLGWMACTTPKATAPGTATTPPTPTATGTTPSTDTSPGPTTAPPTQTVPTTETTGTHTTGSTSTPTALTDGDGDGWTDVDDCFPDDPLRYPGAPALCTDRTCGWDFCGGLCGGVACVDQPSENTTLQILGAWSLPGTSDAMLVEDPNEAPAGGIFLGQVCYAADGSADGDTPLHRLYRADPGADGDDHMMSLLSTEGAPDYAFEGTLAHGWSAPPEGTDLLWRYLSTTPYDHDVGFVGNPPAGYTAEGPLAWVYPRNGLADETRVDVAGAEVALALNTTAGGAVWSLTWGGLEFLSAYDFGRQLQIAFQMGGAGEADNPTEAGDAHATPYDPVGWRHGSPLLAHSVGPGTAWTRTRPLQWLPAGFLSAGQDTTRNPVAWDGTFEKDITLDYAGNPHIIAWTTQITFPEDHGALNIELATAYLTGAFDTFYTYDAAAGLLTDKSAGIPPMGCVDPSLDPDQRPTAGGVIVSTSTGSHALGVYRNRPMNPVEGYGLCSFLTGGTTPSDFSTTKWNLLERPTGGLSAGTYAWDLFLVVGTLSDCTDAMDTLYARGD